MRIYPIEPIKDNKDKVNNRPSHRQKVVNLFLGWPGVCLSLALYLPVFVDLSQPFIDGQFTEHSGAFVHLDMLMHTMAIFLCLAMLLSRQLRPIHIGGALVLTLLASDMGVDIFSSYLHPFLIEHSLYPEHFGRGNNSNQSNQYAKMLMGCIALAALAITLTRRKWRSLDRIFIFLGAASILATTVLFHLVIRESIFESRLHQRTLMAMAAEAPQKWIFEAICKHHEMQCVEASIKDPLPSMGRADIDAVTQKVIPSSAGTRGYSFDLTGSMPAIGSGRLKGYHVLYHWPTVETFRIVVETKQRSRTLQKFQLVYSWIAIPAHLLWLIGPIFLIFWHKRRFKNRAIAFHLAKHN